jgi:hypothetical protein
VTVLHTFQGAEGTGCSVELLQASDGSLYGATNPGGLGSSVAFKSDLNGTLTVLHTFDPYFECEEPTGRLVEGLDGFF